MTIITKGKSSFCLEDFCIETPTVSKYTFQVGIPTTPFRVRPAQGLSLHPPCVHVALIENQWWLVHRNIVKQMSLSTLYQAELFFCIKEGGTYSILPVTLPKPGYTHSWFEAWQENVEVAENNWILTESNRQLGMHTHRRVRCNTPVVWPEISDEEWIKQAFAGRVIDSLDHPHVKRNPVRETYDPIFEEL